MSGWHEQAACLGQDTELWFPYPGDLFTKSYALRVCGSCPVRRECLDAALAEETGAVKGVYGIRGGMDADQRRQLHRRRRRLSS